MQFGMILDDCELVEEAQNKDEKLDFVDDKSDNSNED